MENIHGLDVGICADFITGDITGVLGSQVNLDFGGADGDDCACDRISCV